jgi:mono/diheme cytochrome c family protein
MRFCPAYSVIARVIAALALATLFALRLAHGATEAERRGEELLRENCARCHAIGRTGPSPHPSAPPFRTLSQKYPIDGLAEALAEGFSVGHPDMPEFTFEPDEVAAIIAYLKSIQEQ